MKNMERNEETVLERCAGAVETSMPKMDYAPVAMRKRSPLKIIAITAALAIAAAFVIYGAGIMARNYMIDTYRGAIHP